MFVRRKGVACAALVALLACALATAMQPVSLAAPVTVSFTVASHTTIVPTLCQSGVSGRTDFGSVQPTTKLVTSADCRIQFDSSNATARLMLTQTDREGEALWGGESAGGFEPTFDGGDGYRVHTMVAGSNERYFDATMQNGRSMIAVGLQIVSGNEESTVTRYNSDGSVDTTFGTSGKTRFSTAAADYATGVTIAPDGTIVVVGSTDYGENMYIARLDADGNPISTWGTAGVMTQDFRPGTPEEPLDVAVLTDGSIVLSGWLDQANPDAYVAKFDATGAPDAGFGAGGMRTIDVAGSRDVGWHLAVQPDGKFLVAGPGRKVGNGEDDLFVARVTTTGDIDTLTFGGGDGLYTYDSGPAGEMDSGSGLAVQPDGRIVAGGGIVIRHDGQNTEHATDIDLHAGRLAPPCRPGATWAEDGNLTCTTVDTDPWKPIARIATDPSAEVARVTTSVTNGIVDLRFGMLVSSSQRTGKLVAPITFEVIAPA